ncbi:sensor histidine kinase [Luteitalea sp.]|uniref:sensor histidine kinase n=1 Tax=Luteitalea sp. TaxID=2004800 RepID=UPI0025C25E30|nr:sensor histidine kinase [Luteitalea sp.]
MRVPEPDTLFRVIAVLASLNVAFPQLVRAARVGGTHGATSAALQVALGLLFIAAFWASTAGDPDERTSRRTRILFGVQVVVAMAMLHYFVIVAATAAWLFAPRTAVRWLAWQLGLFLMMAVVPLMVDLGPGWIGLGVFVPDSATTPASVAVPTVVVYMAGWQLFAFAVGYLAAGERRANLALQRSTRELVATQQMLAESHRVAERIQISRELHDTLGHSLTVLNVNLELARHLVDGRAAEAITRAQTVGRVLLADVRDVVHTLGADRSIDLQRALATLARGSTAPTVRLSWPESLVVTNPAVAHTLFRCVQEALTNAIRHGRARSVWVDLWHTRDELSLRVRDDGIGAAEIREGHGLLGMRERLEALGGRCRIESAPGAGVTLTVSVPLPGEVA